MRGGYKSGFKFMFFPAFLCIATLFIARFFSPKFEGGNKAEPKKTGGGADLPATFRYFAVFTFFSAGGYVSFQLLSFHFKTHALLPDAYIPLLYSLAMGVDALSALATGKLYDRLGFKVLLAVPLFTAPIALLGFGNGLAAVISGVVLWGIVMGMHETIMRAAVCDLIPLGRRGTAYGIFNTVYGLSVLAGNTLFGFLYAVSTVYIVSISAVMQLLAIGVIIPVLRMKPSKNC